MKAILLDILTLTLIIVVMGCLFWLVGRNIYPDMTFTQGGAVATGIMAARYTVHATDQYIINN